MDKIKRIFASALCALLLVTLSPAVFPAMTAWANVKITEPYDKDILSGSDDGDRLVAFGGYVWYVIGHDDGENDGFTGIAGKIQGKPTITLLMGDANYVSEDGVSNTKEDMKDAKFYKAASRYDEIKDKLRKFYDSFSYNDRSLIGLANVSKEITTSEKDIYDHLVDYENIYTGEYVWLLSAGETRSIFDIRRTESSAMGPFGNIYKLFEHTTPSWTRTTFNEYGAVFSGDRTKPDIASVADGGIHVRPVLQVDLSKIFFISETESHTFGKENAKPENPSKILTKANTHGAESPILKFTAIIDDPTIINFKINSDEREKNHEIEFDQRGKKDIAIGYNGASTGGDKFISCVIRDGKNNDSKVLYYGKLAEARNAAGTVSLTVPGDIDPGEYAVQLFMEEINGKYETDFCSEPESVTLTVRPKPESKPGVVPTSIIVNTSAVNAVNNNSNSLPGYNGEQNETIDNSTGVSVKGRFDMSGRAAVMGSFPHVPGECPACDEIRRQQNAGNVIALHNIDLSVPYVGNLEITIPVGAAYESWLLTVLHCDNRELETQTQAVRDAAVSGKWSDLGLFAALKPDDDGYDDPPTGQPPDAARPDGGEGGTVPQTDGNEAAPRIALLIAALIISALSAKRLTKKRGTAQ